MGGKRAGVFLHRFRYKHNNTVFVYVYIGKSTMGVRKCHARYKGCSHACPFFII